jgi:hypothetical protein
MKIELNDKIVTALEVAFAELNNCDEWQQYVSEEEYDDVMEGKSEVESVMEKYKESKS